MGGEGQCWIQCETREHNEGIEAMLVERGGDGFNVRQGSTTGDRGDVVERWSDGFNVWHGSTAKG